jgi:hypothetical protein
MRTELDPFNPASVRDLAEGNQADAPALSDLFVTSGKLLYQQARNIDIS